MSENIMLETKNLGIQFGGLKALDRVSLDVKKNEILGLIGPNGSGKTTFFNILTGIYKPTSGNFYFKDDDLTGRSPQDIAKKGVIRTFQSSRLWFELSIIDNVLMGMFMEKKKGTVIDALFRRKVVDEQFLKMIEIAEHYLQVFNPELVKDKYKQAKELSLVDRRRVEICRALAAKPRLLLLDEPAAGMDVSETSQLMDDIEKLKEEQEGLSVIIIEHDMAVISKIAERVNVLNFGKIIARGSFEDILNNHEVREAYLGKE